MIPLYTQAEFDAAKSKDMLALECCQCHKSFTRDKHQIQTRPPKVCSRVCQGQLLQKPKIIIPCHGCGKERGYTQSDIDHHERAGLKHYYCSSSCACRANRPKRVMAPRQCKRCGETFMRRDTNQSKTNCPACRRKRRPFDITLGKLDRWANGKDRHPSWRHSQVREAARRQHKELLTRPCPSCGYDRHVELCHLKAITSFSKETLMSEVNDISNVLPLCRNCHWELDHYQMSESRLAEAKAKMIAAMTEIK